MNVNAAEQVAPESAVEALLFMVTVKVYVSLPPAAMGAVEDFRVTGVPPVTAVAVAKEARLAPVPAQLVLLAPVMLRSRSEQIVELVELGVAVPASARLMGRLPLLVMVAVPLALLPGPMLILAELKMTVHPVAGVVVSVAVQVPLAVASFRAMVPPANTVAAFGVETDHPARPPKPIAEMARIVIASVMPTLTQLFRMSPLQPVVNPTLVTVAHLQRNATMIW